MDPLSELLLLHNPQGSIDKNCVLSGEWQLPHHAGHLCSVRWHTVAGGDVRLEMPSGAEHVLQAGQVVFLPQNAAHRIVQRHTQPVQLVCGLLQLPASAHAFLTALPETLLLAPQTDTAEARWLAALLPLLGTASPARQPGSDALHSQQINAMFTLAVRDSVASSLPHRSLLALALHPRLGPLFSRLCSTPDRPWTVAEMADQVFMSRATFAALFRQLTHTTPQAALATIRLQLAAQQLAREAQPVIGIALAVGYASESSFHKAFTRAFGCSPGEYRRRARALAST